jgi:hypothetical protein
MTMLDSEKIELIKQMLNEFWNNGTVSEDGYFVLLNAIQSVVDFKRN